MKDISTYKSRLSSVKFSRKLEISQHEVVNSKNGRTYNNASVKVTDLANGIESKRTSDLMFGTNADNVSIGYGEYISEEEVEEALRQELEEAGNLIGGEAHYVNKKGEVQNIEDIIKTVSLASGRIVIGDRNEKIKNQNSANWGIEERGTGTYKKKGVAFLGNVGMQLPKGGYVSRDELIRALEEYEITIPEKVKAQTQETGILRGVAKEEIEIPEFLKKYSKNGSTNTVRKVNKAASTNKVAAQNASLPNARRTIKSSDIEIPEFLKVSEQRKRDEQQAREEMKKSEEQLKADLAEMFGEDGKEIENPFYHIEIPSKAQVELDIKSEAEMAKLKEEIAAGVEKIFGEEKAKKDLDEKMEETSSEIKRMVEEANAENAETNYEEEPHSFRIVQKVKSRVAVFATVAVVGLIATLSYHGAAYANLLANTTPDVAYTQDTEGTEEATEAAETTETAETPQQIEYDTVLSASYNITEETVIADLEDIVQEEIDKQFASLKIGDSINVENGVNAYTSSSATKYKTFGVDGFFGAGTYNITGIAVTYEGKLLGYIENFDNSEELQRTNLSEFVKSVCEQKGVPEDEATIMISAGTEKCGSIGWIDRASVNNEDTILGENLIERTIETVEITGTADNFDGENITLDNGETIQVVDDEGNILNEVEIDGVTYIINSLEITETKVPSETAQEAETETPEEASTEQEPETGTEMESIVIENITKKSVKFNFLDIKNFLALPGLLGIAVAKIAEKRKNKYNDLHATFKKTRTDFEAESLKEHVNKYDEIQDYYNRGRRISFKEYMENCLKTLFVKDSRWEVRELSDENIQEIEEIILNESENIKSKYSDGETFYDPECGDYIDIDDGEVVIKNDESGREDVLPMNAVKKISQIGKENNLFAVGAGLPKFVKKPSYDDNFMGTLKKVCGKVSEFSSSFINGVRDKLRHDAENLRVSKQQNDDDYYEKF